MQHRSPAAVFFLSLITFGIYSLVWEVKTKNEINSLGGDVPTAWLLIVPLANLYWIWKYCTAIEQVSGGRITAVLALILMLLLSVVGMAILQGEFNKLGAAQPVAPGGAPMPQPGAVGVAPVAPTPGYPAAAVPQQPVSVSPTVPPQPPAPQPPLPPSPIQ